MMTEIRFVIMYDSQWWIVDEIIKQRMSITEMIMLKQVSGVTRDDIIKNQ